MKANAKFTIKLEWLETSKLRTHLVARIHLPVEILLEAKGALEALTDSRINSKSQLVSVTYSKSLNECLVVKADHEVNVETFKQKDRMLWWISKSTLWMQLMELQKLWASEERTYAKLAKEARLNQEHRHQLVVAVGDVVSRPSDKVLLWFSKSVVTAMEWVRS